MAVDKKKCVPLGVKVLKSLAKLYFWVNSCYSIGVKCTLKKLAFLSEI